MSKRLSRMQSPGEPYPRPSSPQTHKTRRFDQPPTPPASPSQTSSISSSGTPTSAYHPSSPYSPTSLSFPPSPAPAMNLGARTSGLGGSHTQIHSLPLPEDQNQKYGQYQHHRHLSTNILPGLEPPYISRNLQHQQSTINSQRCDYRHRPHHHPYHEESRRSSKSSSQSNSQARNPPMTLRPQAYARHSDPSYDRQPKSSTAAIPSGIISIAVPPRYPIDDRDLMNDQPGAISSYTRTKQPAPLTLHAPQPIRHPDMLSPRLRASARA